MVREDTSDRLLINLITTNMKKILTLIALLMLVGTMQAQRQVTTFLGIPVDGTKAEMTNKLIAKGFTLKSFDGTEFLEGEFNGAKVHLYIITNNNKVWRIMLCDATPTDENNVKIRFNTLIRQFGANAKYETIDAVPVDESVRLSTAIIVERKTFEAAFNQKSSPAENSAKTSDAAPQTMSATASQTKAEEVYSLANRDETSNTNVSIGGNALSQILQNQYKRIVWFRICRQFRGYYICMYYDNKYNEAHGEDL